MASTIDSEAFFRGRMDSMGLAGPVIVEMINRGWNTLAAFGYSCGYIPGIGNEKVFQDEVLESLLGANWQTDANSPRLRRLFFEAHTLTVSDLRRRAERTESDLPVRMPVEERAVRLARLRIRLPGLEVSGSLEPSHSLIDMLSQQLEAGVLKYTPWVSCTAREQEIQGSKKAVLGHAVFKQDHQGFLKTEQAAESYDAALDSDLLLSHALERRALAFELAALCPYECMMQLNKKLMKEYMKPALPKHNRVSREQIEAADRIAFSKMAEITAGGLGRRADGSWPLEDAMKVVLADPEFHYSLMQTLGPSSSASKRERSATPEKRGVKAKAKAKAKGKSKPTREYDASKTSNRTADGKPICFGFNGPKGCNSKNCKVGQRCARGMHVCWIKGCGGLHCAAEHGAGKA